MHSLPRFILLLLLVVSQAAAGNRNWLLESMEPLSATYGAFEQALYPASKADAADVSFAFSFSSTGTNLDPGVRAAFNLGVFGLALYQTPGPAGTLVEGSSWSIALPLERGFTLGYALRTESSNTEHEITAVLRPIWWMGLGLGIHNIGLTDPAFTAAASFRPFGEIWTLSYQVNGSVLRAPTHAFYSDVRLFKALNLHVKYDFTELYTGLRFDLGGLTLSERSSVLASNRFTAWRHTAEWHVREPAAPPTRRPTTPSKVRRSQAWVSMLLRGAPQAVGGRVDGVEYVPSLLELHLVVNAILDNPSLRGLFLEFGGFGGSYAVMDEVREEIRRLRDAGRRVVVFGESFSQREYYAASAADQVIASRSGEVELRGLRFENLYFRDFLDLVGVGVDVVQAGNYKSYGEPFSRTNQSPYAREEEAHLLSVFASNIFPEISRARKLKQGMDELLAKGPYPAAQALEAGLIDRVAYREDAIDSLQREGVVFRSLASLFTDRDRRWAGTFDPSVAVIEITGSIIDGESFANPLTGEGATGSATVLRALDMAMANPVTRAILVRVDSGGGSVTASDLIWNRLARIATDTRRVVPVIVSFGDVAASGGYYVSASAGHIFASPMSITGSIGVIFTKPNIEGLLSKLKLATDGSGIGPQSGAESLFHPLTPEQRDKAVRDIMGAYREFLGVVRKGRTGKGGFQADKLEEIAQGRVWTGEDAVSNGLVDSHGGIGDAADFIEDMVPAPSDRLSWVYYNPTLEGFPGFPGLLGSRLSFLGSGIRRLAAVFAPTGARLDLVRRIDGNVVRPWENPSLSRWLEQETKRRSGLKFQAPSFRPVEAP